MATTIVTWSVLFYRSGFGENKIYSFPEAPLPLGPLKIPPMHPVVAIFVASAVVLVVVSLITRPPDRKTLDKFF